MKKNISYIALALCLGLSLSTNILAQQETIYPTYQSWQSNPSHFTPTLQTQQFPVKRTTIQPQTSSWWSPYTWIATAKSKLQSAATYALDMANTVRAGAGLDKVSYQMLGVALAGLIYLGYNKEGIINIVDGAYRRLEGMYKVTAPVIGKAVTNPKVVIPTITAAVGTALRRMDKANEERQKQQTQYSTTTQYTAKPYGSTK